LPFAGCRQIPPTLIDKADDFSNHWEALATTLEARFSWLIYFEVKEAVEEGSTRISVEFQIDPTQISLADAKKEIRWFISDWLGVNARLENLQGRRDNADIFPATLALYEASTSALMMSVLVSVVVTLMHLL